MTPEERIQRHRASSARWGKAARARRILEGVCVRGCKRPASTPGGLCLTCAEDNRRRAKLYHKYGSSRQDQRR